jgi:hypothetical protein
MTLADVQRLYDRPAIVQPVGVDGVTSVARPDANAAQAARNEGSKSPCTGAA